MEPSETLGREASASVSERGLQEFIVNIAGISIFFLFDKSPLEFGIRNIESEFITDKPPQIKLQMHNDGFPEKKQDKKIFDSGSTWSLYRNQGMYLLQDDSLDPGSSVEKLVILESDFKSGDIYIKNDLFNQNLIPDPLGYPLNQVLMILLLSHLGGLLFHACGIEDRGLGYLFLGNSTHGKSTMARLWSENQATVLNDDRVIVRKKDGELWMYGTPWHGDFAEVSPKGIPINRIFFLRHGKRNKAVPKEDREAVSMLLTRCFPPLWDKKGMDDSVGLCHLIANKLPCYELSFIPNSQIINFVRNI
jgi:hypothetical protein